MEGTLRLFVPIVNVREYGRKCLSGIMLIVLLHMLAVSTERFSVTDEPENSAQVFPAMAGEDVFVDKGNVLKERVLDPFVKTEIKADRIETALLPDSMIVESMKIDGKENTMNGFYDMDADAAVNTAVDTVTVPSENAGVGETENPTTEETGTPILWEVTCYGNGGFRQLLLIHLTQILLREMSCRCLYMKGRFSPDGMRMKRVRYRLTEQKEKDVPCPCMPDGRQKHIRYPIAVI